eukprot:6189161-Pleurochrysis_carterae.AAC.2
MVGAMDGIGLLNATRLNASCRPDGYILKPDRYVARIRTKSADADSDSDNVSVASFLLSRICLQAHAYDGTCSLWTQAAHDERRMLHETQAGAMLRVPNLHGCARFASLPPPKFR